MKNFGEFFKFLCKFFINLSKFFKSLWWVYFCWMSPRTEILGLFHWVPLPSFFSHRTLMSLMYMCTSMILDRVWFWIGNVKHRDLNCLFCDGVQLGDIFLFESSQCVSYFTVILHLNKCSCSGGSIASIGIEFLLLWDGN